jgi:putrescine---pyruvate transaminase
VLVGDRVAEVLIEKGGEFNHGYTYSGHPVACAVGLANIGLIQRGAWSSMCANDDVGTVSGRSASRSWPITRWWAMRRDLRPVAGLVLVKDKATRGLFDEEVASACLPRHCFRTA